MTDAKNDLPDRPADGSTDATHEQESHTDAVPDGSGSDAADGDAEQDTASGGSPEH